MQLKNLKIAALALGLGVVGSAAASAAVVPATPIAPNSNLMINTSALGSLGALGQDLKTGVAEKARWHGRRHYRHPRYHRYRGYGYRRGYRRDRWIAPAIIAGTAAVIIGGSIADSQARHRDRWQRCADRYRSFRWSDGTFQPYEGPRQICPYLVR